MFSDHTERYFRYARIEVVDLPDPTGEGMTEQVFTGPIQAQLKDALLPGGTTPSRSMTFKRPDQAEAVTVFNYPYAAVEEILSNAVYHRSYQISEPIVVRITRSRWRSRAIGFDRSITDDDIANLHIQSRIYRNRRIGDFLKELHLIEGATPASPRRSGRYGRTAPPAQVPHGPGAASSAWRFPCTRPSRQPTSRARRTTPSSGRSWLSYRMHPLLMSELSRQLGYKSVSKRLRRVVTAMLGDGRLSAVHEVPASATRPRSKELPLSPHVGQGQSC